MANRRRRLLGRIRRVLGAQSDAEVTPPDPGASQLPDGTVLERCLWVSHAELQTLAVHQGRPQLIIHWSSQVPACADDLPELRELHLFWAHSVDYIAISWDLVNTNITASQAATAVDAWHRDYGLTWHSLLVDGTEGSPVDLLGLAEERFPQVIFKDRTGTVLFHQIGPMDAENRARLPDLFREHLLA